MPWQVPAAGGQLLLWYGVPGTGKTWAIRALASEWREWCQFEYITDQDKLFERAAYLTQVLLDDVKEDDGVPRWRCLILEDTGELLAADAKAHKAHQGQAPSRLLNGRLPPQDQPVFAQLVEEYRWAQINRGRHPFVSYEILAELVRFGWRRS